MHFITHLLAPLLAATLATGAVVHPRQDDNSPCADSEQLECCVQLQNADAPQLAPILKATNATVAEGKQVGVQCKLPRVMVGNVVWC